MLFDQLTIDVCAIGAVQILKKGVVQDVNDERVVTTDCRIIDADIVIGQSVVTTRLSLTS